MAVLGLATGAYAYLMGPALRFLLSGGTGGFGGRAAGAVAGERCSREAALWGFPVVVLVRGRGEGRGRTSASSTSWASSRQKVVADLRREIFAAPLLAVARRSSRASGSGDLLSRFSADVRRVEVAAMYTVGSYLRDSLQVVVLAGVALSHRARCWAG